MKTKMLASVILLMFCCSNGPSAWAGAATTTSLAVTASGSAVTTVPAGTAVTLTATVSASGAPVTAGTVNFCDASVTYCTDIHLLGTAQLTSAGTAAFKFVPGNGTHSYKAVFAGTTSDDASSSTVSSLQVQVTGKLSTATSLAVNPEAATQTYSLTATVIPNGNPPGQPAPSGTISFEDASNGNAVLATANLVAGTGGLNWTSPQQGLIGDAPSFARTADFNLDGIPDLVICECFDNFLSIFTGNGDGAFTSLPDTYTLGGLNRAQITSVVTGDFNHDGKPDIAGYFNNDLETSWPTEILVLLGNGDGTFTQGPATTLGTAFPIRGSMAVGDFNRDGLLDLVATETVGTTTTVNILFGNGDGSFTPAASSVATSNDSVQVVVGDFNNDGKADLAGALNDGNTVIVLLGNGDGTFTTAPNPSTVSSLAGLVAADLNGDGKLDLAALNSSTTITVLLGNGDGAFTAAPASTTTSVPSQLAAGDFNGDGKVDLAAANGFNSSTVSILLGDGTGKFTEASVHPAAPGTVDLTSGDWNGDGITDLFAEDGSFNTTVLLAHAGPPATATVSGLNISPTAQVFAHYAGDSLYNASDSATVTPPPFIPVLTVSTYNLDFGSQAMNTQSAVQSITLTNTGTAALIFNSIGIAGAVSPDGWGTQFATSNSCGATLTVNASCIINVRFTPLSTDYVITALVIQSNAHSYPDNINLTGTGTFPSLFVSNNRIEFGNQAVGTSSAVQEVTLINGGTPTNISSIWWDGAPPGTFAISSTCGTTLAASASCIVRMRFNPKAMGLVRSVVYVTNSATTTPVQIGMAGTGVTP